MSFKEIEAKEIDGNLIKRISDEWMLIAAGTKDGFNMMTASWGFVGEMWGKDCAIAMIRPGRHTKKFVDANETFSLCFLGDNKEPHKICGSQSGRDINKAEATGLIPVFENGTVYFEQSKTVLICKKLYTSKIDPKQFTGDSCSKWYPDEDYHDVYVGEIIKVLQKD